VHDSLLTHSLLPGMGASPPWPDVAAVELDGIARRFGRRWVLRGIALHVQPGEAVALMGRNGSGKTTLLRIVSTALSATRGSGRVFGCDLQREAGAVRERVGVLGHAAGLYEDLTAFENLRFALRMSGLPAPRDAIQAALVTVNLADEEDERVRTFSAGMRRRLGLARLLLRPPRLLLLDEPYAAFDAEGVDLVNEFVRQLTRTGASALIATHDFARARPAVDRVVRIVDGIVADGPAPSEDADEDATSPLPGLWTAEGGLR
jgi:heme exporter protein A